MREFFENFRNTDAYEKLQTRYERRIKEERQKQIEEGNRKKKPFLYTVDRMIEHSGLKQHVYFMTAELFLILSVMIMALLFLITYIVCNNILAGLVVDALACIIVYGVMHVFYGNYYVRIEENIMTLLNLIENFNKTEDDIVQIFRKSIPYVGEPIGHILTDFCNEAKAYGDINQAFDNMSAKIEHRKCRELIHNLQVCSRYESNFQYVIRDCRKSMMDYLEIKSERKAIIRNGKAEILILLASAGFIIFLFSNVVSNNIGRLLLESLVGNVILAYCAIVAVFSMVMMLSYDIKGGE